MSIHPTAIVSKDAVLHESTEIGPFVIIEGGARIGKNNRIMASAFVGHGTVIGDNNEIHMGAILGHVPQDKSFKGEESYLEIGNDNVIREYASIHRGSGEGSRTVVGNNCLLMGGCHIAHNCHVGNYVIMANMSGIAGHVEVEDRAFISGGAMIHQFVKIGKIAIIAGNSRVSMDVPPFTIVAERNQVWGINVVGLRRAGLSAGTIQELKELYRIFFKTPLPRSQILEKIHIRSFVSPEVKAFIEFVENSKRGICRAVLEKCNQLSQPNQEE